MDNLKSQLSDYLTGEQLIKELTVFPPIREVSTIDERLTALLDIYKIYIPSIINIVLDSMMNILEISHTKNDDTSYFKLEEPTKKEMVDYILKANKKLMDYHRENKTSDKLLIHNEIITLKYYEDYEEFEKADPESRNEYGTHDKLREYQALPGIKPWKNLPLATLQGNKLIFDGPYEEVSEYLAKYTLFTFDLTDDDIINNYYYSDEKFENYGLEVVFPGNIKKIGFRVLCNKKLRSVTFEEGLEEIEAQAFYESRLENLRLPESLKTVGVDSFGELGAQIKSLYIPKNLVSIGKRALPANSYICAELSVYVPLPARHNT